MMQVLVKYDFTLTDKQKVQFYFIILINNLCNFFLVQQLQAGTQWNIKPKNIQVKIMENTIRITKHKHKNVFFCVHTIIKTKVKFLQPDIEYVKIN